MPFVHLSYCLVFVIQLKFYVDKHARPSCRLWCWSSQWELYYSEKRLKGRVGRYRLGCHCNKSRSSAWNLRASVSSWLQTYSTPVVFPGVGRRREKKGGVLLINEYEWLEHTNLPCLTPFLFSTIFLHFTFIIVVCFVRLKKCPFIDFGFIYFYPYFPTNSRSLSVAPQSTIKIHPPTVTTGEENSVVWDDFPNIAEENEVAVYAFDPNDNESSTWVICRI